jgi:hypothetical protein
MTTDDAPTAHRHIPPPTVQNFPPQPFKIRQPIGAEPRPQSGLVQGWLRICSGVMVLPHPREIPRKQGILSVYA